MPSSLLESYKLKNLIGREMDLVVQGLLQGRQVWLVDLDIGLGEYLIEYIRDVLLNFVYREELSPETYAQCLSRVYQVEDARTPPFTMYTKRQIIVELSFEWDIEFPNMN